MPKKNPKYPGYPGYPGYHKKNTTKTFLHPLFGIRGKLVGPF